MPAHICAAPQTRRPAAERAGFSLRHRRSCAEKWASAVKSGLLRCITVCVGGFVSHRCVLYRTFDRSSRDIVRSHAVCIGRARCVQDAALKCSAELCCCSQWRRRRSSGSIHEDIVRCIAVAGDPLSAEKALLRYDTEICTALAHDAFARGCATAL